ncbi:MAG: tight adherence protein [Cryptosporangiaceae bacterium]|nr:tight adherence protein [Cryptosporangiaceae bacterium]
MLAIGLSALFTAILVVSLSVSAARAGRADVARTMALAERLVPAAGEPADRSFTDRIIVPLTARLGGLGRALTPSGAVARLRRQLDYAGNPVDWTAERVVRIKGVALVMLGAGAGLFASVYTGPPRVVLAVAGGAVFGFFLPDLLVYNNGLKRQESIKRTLPDVLDMLTVCVEAGLGFDAATAQVARNSRGPLAGEFTRILREMQIGKSRAEALRSLGERTTVPELRSFSSAIVQASELGIPVAKVLREQAKEMRIKRRQHAEELAQKVPIKILFPMLFCQFPALFVVIMGPGVLRMVHMFSAS